jgi:hypothetical protein
MQKKYLLLVIFLGFFAGLVAYEITYPPFSTDAEKIGNYEVQVSTIPSAPNVGKDTEIHFLVLDQNGRQVNKIRMGLKIYHNGVLMKEFSQGDHPGAWDIDYVFQEPGNYVFRVGMFDMNTGNIEPYMFNITALDPYLSIFPVLLIAGAGCAAGIIVAILIFTKRTQPKFRY